MIEYLWDRRCIAVHDPKDVQHWQIDEPALTWTVDNKPQVRFLLVFGESSQLQWAHQMVLERVRDSSRFLPIARNRHTIENSEGGFMRFTTIGSALLGIQVDRIIMSDVIGRGRSITSYNACLEWISHLHCRLAPHDPRPGTPDPAAEGSR